LLEQALHGENHPNWNLPERVGNLPLRQALAYFTWLMRFSSADALSIAQRLRLPNEIQEGMVAAKALLETLPGLVGAPPSAVTFHLDGVPAIALFVACLFLEDRSARQLIETYRDSWRRVWPATDGNDLRQMGIQPGPQYRQILGTLRAAWLDGKIASVEEEKHLLQNLIQTLPG
jgi:tRNA nucleotidyltransferase (CCA-adding enzyme)